MEVVAEAGSAGAVLAGFALAVFFGFLANRLGYLSVHKKADKPASGSGGGGGGGGNPPRQQH